MSKLQLKPQFTPVALAVCAALPFAAQAAPTGLSFKAPTANATISGNLYQSSACELVGSGINRVVFYLDGTQLNSEGNAPWNCNLDTRKFSDGTHNLRARAYDSRGRYADAQIAVNIKNSTTSGGTSGGTTGGTSGGTTTGSTPYSGTPVAVPATFEAEDFDKGGNNVAYRDLTSGNAGGQYRTGDSVDIISSADAEGGGHVVNYFQTGEWLAYTIDVPADGTYEIAIRAANKNMSGAGFRAQIDGVDVTGKVAVASTGGWNDFAWFGKSGVPLKAGRHVLKILADQQYFNVNRVRVAAESSTPPTSEPAPTQPAYTGTPFTGTPVALPKAFAAAEFDKGGQGVAYTDKTTGNQGGEFRTSEDVDIINGGDASMPYSVNYFQKGEWLAYTVNVPADGKYDLAIKASHNYSGSPAFRMEVDGVDVTGKVAVPKTGGWSSYQWVGKEGVSLKKGKRVLKVIADDEYFNMAGLSVLATGSSTPSEPTTPQNGAPTVSFKAPTDGAKLSGFVNSTTCEVNASDDVKVTRVDFALGGQAVGSKTSAPWQCAIDTTKFTDGGYQLKATAYDDAGKTSTAEVAVSVENAGGSDPVSGDKPAGLLFWSGYEGAITPSTPFECYNKGCWQELKGTDTTTGFSWPPKIAQSAGKFQLLVNGSTPPSTSSVYNYMYNEIQTVTGPKGKSSRALYSHIAQSGCCGTEPQGSYATQNPYLLFPTADVKNLYVSYWFKFQPDLKEKLHSGDAWRPLFEFKTNDDDYRLTVGVLAYGGATPYWEVKTDSWNPTRKTFWKVTTQNQLTVPGGKWMKLEVYWNRSSGSDGRIWVAVDGKVIADKQGSNIGPHGSRINRIFLSQLYSGSSYPIYQWVDDVQIWSGFPTAKSGDAWYDPPYASR